MISAPPWKEILWNNHEFRVKVIISSCMNRKKLPFKSGNSYVTLNFLTNERQNQEWITVFHFCSLKSQLWWVNASFPTSIFLYAPNYCLSSISTLTFGTWQLCKTIPAWIQKMNLSHKGESDRHYYLPLSVIREVYISPC